VKHVKLYEEFISEANNMRTLRGFLKELNKEYGSTPSEQALADFIYNNYEAITGEKLKDSDPESNDHIADIVSHFKMDGEDFMIAWHDRANESLNIVNEASTVKDEVISRLSDFFRVSPNALKKFNFDGKDNIKELTKALNSTSDQGTEMYYKVAIDLAKKDLGESVSEGQELIFDIVEPEFNDLKGKLDNLNKKTVDLKWRKALDQIQREVEKLEFFISKYDRQLGAIETNESVNEAR